MPPPISGAHKGSIVRFTTPCTWMQIPKEGTARRVSDKTEKQFLGGGFEEPSWGWCGRGGRGVAILAPRGTCGAESLLLFAGAEPPLALADVPEQAAVDRDLAL